MLFGTRALAGVLAGALVSGVQMAISMSNTGGAWDNAKKYVEAGASEHAASLGGKGSDAHKAAVIGDTVGDPLKDTSGPLAQHPDQADGRRVAGVRAVLQGAHPGRDRREAVWAELRTESFDEERK